MLDNPYQSSLNYLKIYDNIIIELCVIYTFIALQLNPLPSI
jgi:hypothetical protein